VLSFLNKVAAACLAWIGRVFIRGQVSFLREHLEAQLESNRVCKGRVADSLIKLLVVGEDRRFWNHGGVDLLAMCRALCHILIHRQLHGASTIEQQLVRTLTGYRKLSLKRKAREIILACVLGDFLDKREVAALGRSLIGGPSANRMTLGRTWILL
jgi:membrane carboxypeptidase/penicillin-binding protein PbpC